MSRKYGMKWLDREKKEKYIHLQLIAFRKPGERPKGKTDGGFRELLNDVDIVVIGKLSSESELPGVVLIIMEVKTSSESSKSCRWK